jgi:hypothetical protein
VVGPRSLIDSIHIVPMLKSMDIYQGVGSLAMIAMTHTTANRL